MKMHTPQEKEVGIDGMVTNSIATNVTMDADRLAQLAQEKEQEWREIQQLRNQSRELALREKDKELKDEREKLHRLKEDFKYNFKLLNDRDAELATYDTTITDLRKAVVMRDAEISELKIKLHEMQNMAAREATIRDELQSTYQKRIREKQAELDQYRLKKDAEIEEERKELESFRRNLQRQLKEVEEELELQKRELNAGFEDAMRKREHEYRQQTDEMHTTVLAHELKVKLLTKELESCKMNQVENSTERQKAEGNQHNLEKELRNKEWQLQDITAMKNAKISELEGKLKQMDGDMRRVDNNCQRKFGELDRSLREKEISVKKMKEALMEKDQNSDVKVRDLESKLEQAEIKLKQLEWAKQDTEKDKQTVIERLEEELSESKREVEKLLKEKSKVSVTREMELQALRESESQLQIHLQESKRHIERYKKELQETLERQSALEQSKAQSDLDWQRRLEDIERVQYERSEDLVKNLMKAKDEAQAEVKQKERELTEGSDLIRVLTADRDRALATIKQYGLKVNQDIDLSAFSDLPKSSSSQMEQLQQQNNNLREVIRKMRGEMEQLGQQVPDHHSRARNTTASNTVTQEYVKNLENELHSWKMKYRQLQDRGTAGRDAVDTAGRDAIDAAVAATDNTLIQQHIASLNNTISQLRSEKVEFSAQLRKQQTRLQYLETCGDSANKLQVEKQVQVEQLQYELGAADRRHNAELVSLRRQLTEAQLQLDEARKEADEYYKANLQHNQHVTNMEHELSTMKMELANKRQPVTFGAQELLIQQLHDEVERLQHDKQGDHVTWDQPMRGEKFGESKDMSQMRRKLHQAAKHIGQLAKDKQQLIEVNNRLRADLNKNGIKPTSILRAPPPPRDGTRSIVATHGGQGVDTLESKLTQLEQLQYEVTKLQLGQGQLGDVQVLRLSQESVEDDFQPKSILKNSGLQEVPTKLEKSQQPSHYDAVMQSSLRPRTAESDTLTRPATQMSEVSQRSSDKLLRSSEGHLLMSMSSLEGESLKELWHMLDQEGPSPRIFTPRGAGGDTLKSLPEGEHSSSDSLTVKGHHPFVVGKSNNEPPSLSKKAAGKLAPKRAPKAKIRNYNLRDDL